MTTLTCPNCGAQLDIEEKRQFAFCQYCGTKVYNITNSVELNRSAEIYNLIARAREFELKGDYIRMEEYCSRILDIDSNNEDARAMERRIPSFSNSPNIEIIYTSNLDNKIKLRITTDGRNWQILSKGETVFLTLPSGKHRILFSGRKQLSYDVLINNPKERITLEYIVEGRHTYIQMH